jgi:hypothetical protein
MNTSTGLSKPDTAASAKATGNIQEETGPLLQDFEHSSPRTTVAEYFMDYNETQKSKSSSIMPSSKKRKKNKHSANENVAALYSEDMGTQGIKTSSLAPQLDIQTFRVKVDKKEKHKRKRRMVSFMM